MSVHIREFVLRLGIDDKDKRGTESEGPSVTQSDLDALRRELTRRYQAIVSETRPQPFDR